MFDRVPLFYLFPLFSAVFFIYYFYFDDTSSNPLYLRATSGSTGALFSGNSTRVFFKHYVISAGIPYSKDHVLCDNWAVITTINLPTNTVKQISDSPGWCIVIIGDKKSPKLYTLNVSQTVVYIASDDQSKLPYQIIKHLPWNHFGRKNIGFVYAIHHGAKFIYDTDDDNELKYVPFQIPSPVLSSVDEISIKPQTFNPYVHFGCTLASSDAPAFSWPRGFPLASIQDVESYTVASVHVITDFVPSVIQSLADHDPDVDAIYRLTRRLPLRFLHDRSVAIPKGVYSPFNAQSTMVHYAAFFGLLLPISVTGRVSDIWRSYIWQRLLWNFGGKIVFSAPWVSQYRNTHNYLADFNAENDLYFKTQELLRVLDKFQSTEACERQMVAMMIFLYERNFIEETDILLCLSWIEDLYASGYKFPSTVN